MIFDWTISLGNMLTIAGFVGSGIAFVVFMRSDLMVLAHRVTSLEGTMRELVQSNLAMAEQKGRLDSIDDRLNNISHRVDSLINHQIRRGERNGE